MSVILIRGTVNRPGKRVSAEKGNQLGPEKTKTKFPDKERVDKAEKYNSCS